MERGCRPSSPSTDEYEVFLSFRGKDTRKTFTDCLYENMKGAGIRVYKDDNELCVGQKIEKLLQDIQRSRIYIPILSKNYAESQWCMRELALMVQIASRSNGKKVILPIFFEVESEDVKLKTTSVYLDALLQHEQRIGSDTVKEWREALMQVGEIKAWNVTKSDGHGQLITRVVQEIKKRNNGYKNMTEHFVEDTVQIDKIMSLLDIHSGGVRFVGLCGIGGIGKTTIAKAVFNKISSHFDNCCFLEKVRLASRPDREGLVHLQKQLLSCILNTEFTDNFYDVSDGVSMIKTALRKKKVLVVLDDLDENKQVENLAGKHDWFESGSRVIVTTRDMNILMNEHINEKNQSWFTHEVKEMNVDQALQLFSRHVFGTDSPLEEYADLSGQMISTFGKFPPAIERLGSALYGRHDRAAWEDKLKSQKAPSEKLEEILINNSEGFAGSQRQAFAASVPNKSAISSNPDLTVPEDNERAHEAGQGKNMKHEADDEEPDNQAQRLNFFSPVSDGTRQLQIIEYGDLEMLEELGSGTYGTVYHGKWNDTDVAIKCFSQEHSEQEGVIDDFLKEAAKLANLRHPHVLVFYGVVVDSPEGSLATVTEFMIDGSLRNALQEHKWYLDNRIRVLIAKGVALGMKHLHEKNIVHSDLKSDNLLVSLGDPRQPMCKIGDLGLSKVKRLTQNSGDVRGTLPWMAPELLDGRHSQVSKKGDVFSFGIVMWEILTAEVPYANLRRQAIIGGIVRNTLRPPIPETCDPDWRSLMERCWSSEPQERPSFTEIVKELSTMEIRFRPQVQNRA